MRALAYSVVHQPVMRALACGIVHYAPYMVPSLLMGLAQHYKSIQHAWGYSARECTNVDGWMNKTWMDGWKFGWMDECLDGWIDEWMVE